MVWVTTGIVIRKMMRSTSITSTNGVVLMVELKSSSASPSGEPTFIAMALRLARASAHQHRVQVGAKRSNLLHDGLVATYQEVVAQHRGNGNRQAHRRHDQCLTDRTCDLVDRCLTRNAD